MIVDGGEVADIAKTIFLKKGEGVGTYGSTSYNYLDTYGFPNTIRFSRPTVVPAYCKLTISPAADYLSSAEDEIKARIVAYINSLDIGESVNIARVLASAVKTDAGIVDERFSVEAITLGPFLQGQLLSHLAARPRHKLLPVSQLRGMRQFLALWKTSRWRCRHERCKSLYRADCRGAF